MNKLLNSSGLQQMPEEELHIVQSGLTMELHSVYWGVFVLASLTMIGMLFLPKARKQNSR